MPFTAHVVARGFFTINVLGAWFMPITHNINAEAFIMGVTCLGAICIMTLKNKLLIVVCLATIFTIRHALKIVVPK